MPVRARWHSPVVVDDDDVFDEQIEDVGTPIVLTAEGEEAELNAALVQSIRAEGELDEHGITCAIKNAQATSCHACPLFRDDGSGKAELCAIGREQERICTLLMVRKHGG